MLSLSPNPKNIIDIGIITPVPEVPHILPTVENIIMSVLPAYSIFIRGKNDLCSQKPTPSLFI